MKHSTQSRNGRIETLETRTLFSGGLDPTFGTGGYITVPSAPAGVSYSQSVAQVQSDGKLLVAAAVDNGPVEAIRFLANGQLDARFGSNGIAILAQSGIPLPLSIAQTAAGNIVVAVNSLISGASSIFQLNASGKPDPTFGRGGNVTLPTDFYSSSLSVQGNQILVAGTFNSAHTVAGQTGELLRLNANGTPDSGFGKAGVVVFASVPTVGKALATPGNEIAVLLLPGSSGLYSIELLHNDGSVDMSFATDGSYSSANRLELQAVGPAGSLVVTAQISQGDFSQVYEVSRLKQNGIADPAFTPFDVTARFPTLAVESDGGLLVDTELDPPTIQHYSITGKLIRTTAAPQAFTHQATLLLPLASGGYILLANPTLAYKLTSADHLDVSFGYYGALAALTTPQPPYAFSAVATLPNRKVIAAGIGNNGVSDILEVYRYNVNGSLDTSFGAEGIAQTGFGELAAHNVSMLIQPNGKIVAVAGIGGDNSIGLPPTSFALVRYNSSGSIDSTFGKGGVVIVNGDGGYTAPVVMWQDSKLLIGTATTLYRFNGNGSIDTNFAKGLPGGEAFAVQPDGKILVNAVNSNNNMNEPATFVTRYNQNGSLDKTFGTNGTAASVANGEGIIANQILVETSGTIVLVDTIDSPVYFGNVELLALNPDGTADSAFGSTGVVISAFSDPSRIPTLLQQPNGQLLLAVTGFQGFVDAGSLGGQYAIVTRYSAAGRLDKTFGKDGTAFGGSEIPIVTREGGPLTTESIAALDRAGRLLLVGGNGPAAANIFAIDTNNDTGTITGYMFYDTNGNGKRDPGDHALNWTCYIDVDNDGHYDNADIRIYTDAAGHFTIPNLAPGVYRIRQSQVSHWQKTTPAEYTVTVTTGTTITGINFGSRFIG